MTFALYLISFFVYTAILILGIFTAGNEPFGYGLFSFYFAIPTLSFVTALILNKNNAKCKWLYPFIFSVFGIVIALIVTLASLSTWAMFLDVWPLCVFPVFIGSIIGRCLRTN